MPPSAGFSLDHLSPSEFEEYCYDLLTELGFVNLQWRKGTGLQASPADHGRDIECEQRQEDVDGRAYLKKWFVECKHYTKGVPPDVLQGALAWATAKGPDTLVIMVSNFLSNPTKEFLEAFKTNNSPRFTIKIWERPDLEKLTLGRSKLMRKYRIAGEFPILEILHPAHILYMTESRYNTLDYLFRQLDQLSERERDNSVGWLYTVILKPRRRKPVTGRETVRELWIDEVSYSAFKRRCYEIALSGHLDQALLVFLIINFVLQCQLSIGNTTAIDEFVDRMKWMLAFAQSNPPADPEEQESLDRFAAHTEEKIINAHANTHEHYRIYEQFCNTVVSALLLENIYSQEEDH